VDAIPKQPVSERRRNLDGTESFFGIWSLLKSVRQHARLVIELARRDLSDLHAGQAAGQLWLFAHPALILIVYAVLFTSVFRVRIGANGPTDYIVYLLAGLAPWLMTQDAVIRSTTAIVANAGIVKKVMFPPEVIVAKTVLASCFAQGILLALAFAFIVFERRGISVSYLLLPALGLLHVMLIWGLALAVAALTPFIRDITEVARAFVTVNIYLMPVTYAPSMVPEALRAALYLNPFSHLVWCYQDVLYFGAIEHPWSWLALLVLSVTCMLAGSAIFSKLRHHFTSVL
jgi:lipopolysaccharide transport system permease protein